MFLQMQCYGNGRMLRLEVAGRRPGGRAKRRFMHVVKEDVESVGARDDDAEEEAADWLWPIAEGNSPKPKMLSFEPIRQRRFCQTPRPVHLHVCDSFNSFLREFRNAITLILKKNKTKKTVMTCTVIDRSSAVSLCAVLPLSSAEGLSFNKISSSERLRRRR